MAGGLGLVKKLFPKTRTGLTRMLRHMVSKKKRRFQQDGFDLDLSYITPRMVAMAAPSEGHEGFYRNPVRKVVKFLQEFHPGVYRVYNLRSERAAGGDYEELDFDGRVARFPFDDHQPPPLHLIKLFCDDVHEWLQAHPDHMVAVHCKAGKGRTGTMICAYLLHSGEFDSPERAMDCFAQERTYDAKGITIVSQRRYVEYYHRILRDGPVAPCEVELRTIQLDLGSLEEDAVEVKVWARRSGEAADKLRLVASTSPEGDDVEPVILELKVSHEARRTLSPMLPLLLEGDVKVEVYGQAPMFGRRSSTGGSGSTISRSLSSLLIMKDSRLLWHTWLNTAYLPVDGVCSLVRNELDIAQKSLDDDVSMRLHFAMDSTGAASPSELSPATEHPLPDDAFGSMREVTPDAPVLTTVSARKPASRLMTVARESAAEASGGDGDAAGASTSAEAVVLEEVAGLDRTPSSPTSPAGGGCQASTAALNDSMNESLARMRSALEKLHVEQHGIEMLGEQMQQLVERLDSPPPPKS